MRLLFATNCKLSKDDGAPKTATSNYRTSLLSRFKQKPSQIHFSTAKRVLRYIKGTINYGLKFEKVVSRDLIGYCDSDGAGSLDDSRSTKGYYFSFYSAIFFWNSKKQKLVAQSLTETKYISTAATAYQAIWIKKILGDLGYQ
ncbi:uncharacterized protein LOC110419638 [Herrania umbratica]|uniref:Uncharacterized protein LOC110419638 n=1 Tax=Herrania umbratica TaxID=108875 RepID=A0A6J1ANH1_9ROSI|nr:uncharacterized protein LOC110419638 [Herrania umbratica]